MLELLSLPLLSFEFLETGLDLASLVRFHDSLTNVIAGWHADLSDLIELLLMDALMAGTQAKKSRHYKLRLPPAGGSLLVH